MRLKTTLWTAFGCALPAMLSACSDGVMGDGRETQRQGVTSGGACAVEYTHTTWSDGLRGDITISNVGQGSYEAWSLGFTFQANERVTEVWNAAYAQSDQTVKLTAGAWNGHLAPGESTTITFLADATSPGGSPAAFVMNGAACSMTLGPPAASATTPTVAAPANTAAAAPANTAASATTTTASPAAPAGGAKPWRPFNASSPWNTPIAAAAQVDAASDELIADFAASSEWPWMSINIESYGIPVYYADASTPKQNVLASTVGGQGFESGSADVPIPAGAAPAVGTDAHLLVIDRETQQEWGMWAAANSASGWTAEVAATSDLAGSGVRPPTANAPWWMGHGARACGYPLSAGLITVEEMRAGVIEHALVIAYPHIRSRYYTSPASTAQNTFATALPTRGMPCGARVQLDPNLDLDSLGLSTSGKIVARALQTYGAFVGDYSGAMSIYADASPTAQAAWRAALLDTYEIRDKVALTMFRALAIGELNDNGN